MPDMKHLDYLTAVTAHDVVELRRKEQTYRGSWKQRGGIGAFMMLARKWDRLEPMAESFSYDIFKSIAVQVPAEKAIGAGEGSDGTVLAEIRDLRRYLTLVEAEMMARGVVAVPEVADEVADTAAVLRPLVVATRAGGAPRASDSNKHGHEAERLEGLASRSGHWAERVQDGLTLGDYKKMRLPCMIYDRHSLDRNPPDEAVAVLDRRHVATYIWDHLPRLSRELNAKERELTPSEYRWMYEWREEKFRMREEFVECWGREA
jgi:hypothetical protein